MAPENLQPLLTLKDGVGGNSTTISIAHVRGNIFLDFVRHQYHGKRQASVPDIIGLNRVGSPILDTQSCPAVLLNVL